jgi:hypothetical protein
MNFTFADFRAALLDYDFTNVVAIFHQYKANPENFMAHGPFYVLERLHAFHSRKKGYEAEARYVASLPVPEEVSALQRILDVTSQLTQKIRAR